MKQKLALFLSLFLLLGIPLATYSLVQAQTDRQDRVEAMAPGTDLNLDKYSNENSQAIITSLGCAITSCAVDTNNDGNPDMPLNHGALPTLASGITYLATKPPVHTGEYIADVLQNFGIVQPAYAQGLGFSALSPVLQIWKAFRNIAFFIYIIMFVVMGFMIMFRTQVGHQTIVTIQSALPQLLVTLIAITFSYAIAGFVVDLIYFSIFVITELFQAFSILDSAAKTRDVVLGLSVFRIGISYFIGAREVAGPAANAVSAIIQGLVGLPGGLFDWIIDGLAYLIIAIAILIAMFRTFFGLLMAYIGIIIATIFAPIQLLLNAIPGNNTFSTWLKGLIANAAIFPAVIIMIIIGVYLVGGTSTNYDMGIAQGPDAAGFGFREGSGFVPPLITSRGYRNNEEFGVEHIRAIIGLGFIMLLPETIKIVKKAMGVEDQGLGEMVTGGLQRGSTIITGGGTRVYRGARKTMQEQEQREAQYTQAEQIVTGMGGTMTAAPPSQSRRQAIGRTIRNIFEG